MDMLVDTLLSRLAHASVQALLLTAVVYAICRYVRALSAATRTVLWWLLAAQLVAGVAFPALISLPLLPAIESPSALSSIMSAAPAMSSEPMASATGTSADALAASMPGGNVTGSRNPVGPSLPGEAPRTMPFGAMLLAAWLAVVLLQTAIALVRWYQVAGIVSRAMPHDDVRVETLCARRARELGLRRSPRLAVSDEVESPQVIGLWRPTILLPLDDRLGADELDMALMHELAHVRRGDLVLGWIPVIARTLFFFHPAVYVAIREYALCREAACDALVVARNRQAPRQYGRLLVRLGVSPQPHHALPGASPTFVTLKRRLDMLAHANDSHPRALAWGLVAAIALVGVVPWNVVAADGTSAVRAQSAVPVAPAAPAVPAVPATPATPAAAALPAPEADAAEAMIVPAPPAPPALPPAPPHAPPGLPAAPPPPPPAPPAPPVASSHGHTVSTINFSGNASNAFFFTADGVQVMNGAPEDVSRAEAGRQGSTGYAWFREGKQAWVIHDPATIKRIAAVYARTAQPADKAAMSADKRMELDRRQAALNEQMRKLSQRRADLAVKESDPTAPNDREAYAAGHAALAREMADVGRQMGEIGRVRAMEGRTQAEWGRRQAEAANKGNEEVKAILAEAVRNHTAQAAR